MTTIDFLALRDRRQEPLPSEPGRYLVAVDGSPRSDAALAVATATAATNGADVELVITLESAPAAANSNALHTSEELAMRRAARIARARTQIQRVTGSANRWPLAVVEGACAPTVARIAAERGASLIIVGSCRRGLMQRLARPETAVALLDETDVPILAVPPDKHWQPRRALVCTDFGPESIRGARLALQLMREGGIIYLVHVARERDVNEHEMRNRLSDIARNLGAPPATFIEPVLLHGETVTTLLSYASATFVDLMVVGSYGRGSFSRMLMGAAPVRVVRGAGCAVLVVPERR